MEQSNGRFDQLLIMVIDGSGAQYFTIVVFGGRMKKITWHPEDWRDYYTFMPVEINILETCI